MSPKLAAWLAMFVAVAAPSLAQAQTTLRLWHAYREDGDEQRALRDALSRFESAHPGTHVEVLAVPFDGYATKLAAAIPAGNGPDIFVDAHERLGDFSKRGIVAPVLDALPDEDTAGFAPGAIGAVSLDGVRLGVPLSRKCLALFVNDSLVTRDPVDLEAIAELQSSLPRGTVALAHTAGSSYAHHPFLAAFGGEFLGADNSYGMSSPAGIQSIDLIHAWVKRGVIPDEANGSLVADLFSSGRAATAIGGPWLAGDLRGGVKYHVIPLPPLRATGRAAQPLLTVEAALLSPQGASRSEARALARYLGGEEATSIRSTIGRMVSARASTHGSVSGDPFLDAFARAADNAVPMKPAMRLLFEPSDRALRKVLRGDATAEVALEEAAHRYDDVRRPLPPRTSSLPYALLLGIASLGGALAMYRRAREPNMGDAVRRSLPAYAYVALSVIAVAVLVVGPLAVGAASSFFAGRGDEMRFVGLAHYIAILTARGGALLGSGSFYLVLLVTVLWTFTNVFLHVVIGTSLGILLSNPALRLRAAYRVLLVVPWAVPSYVTALAWKGLFHRQFGAINAILAAVGVEPVAWFSRFSTAFAANLSTNVWLGFPFLMVITMGAITSVPKDVLEAAEVDGATRWQRMRLVTLPMIRPVLTPAVALGAVWTFNMFNVVFLVSGGDPDGTTDILVSEAYRWAFTREAQIGYASAYAVLIFLMLFGTSKAMDVWRARREPS